MALPWFLFNRANLATPSIIEDLKLGHELAEAGNYPVFVEQATVWSEAETLANTLAQRQRWEGGFLSEAIRRGPSQLIKAAGSGDLRGMWAGLSIMVPPFALLVLGDSAVLLFATFILWALNGEPIVLLTLALPLFVAAVGLILAWSHGGSKFVSLGALLRAPAYLVWKVPLYGRFLRRGAPDEWVRTDRSQ